jgi:hypothetical protein
MTQVKNRSCFFSLALPVLLLLPTSYGLGQAPKKPKDLTFDGIKFPIEKGAKFKRSMLTKKIEDLDGQRIRIRGYILPSFQQKGIKQFILVRDNMECCFGPGAALYDCIVVEMAKGKSTSFTVRPIAVEGTFAIRPFKGPDGNHLAVYHLTGLSVK